MAGKTVLDMESESLASMQTAGGYVMGSKDGASKKVPLSDFAKAADIPPTVTVDSAMSTTSENPVQNKVITAAVGGKASVGAIAPEYSDLTFPVASGTACMHDGLLYYANQTIATSENWTAAHWTLTSSTEQTALVEAKIGSVKNGGALTSAASVDVPNNSVSTLSTSEAALTLNVNVGASEIPNFAVDITAGAAITLTVTKTVGSTTTTLNYSAAAGNELESGKLYQVSCVGSCWTLAEFTAPTP